MDRRHVTVTHDGPYTTTRGDRYDSEAHPNEIAKAIRRGHGWHDFNITVVEDQSWALEDSEPTEWDPYPRPTLSEHAREVGERLALIGARYVKNTRDPYTDYFSGGHVMVFTSEYPGGGMCL